MGSRDYVTFNHKAAEVYALLDVDKDGFLSYDELRKGFLKLKVPLAEQDELLKEMHCDPEGKSKGVSKEDFKEYSERQYKKVKNLFEEIDINRDHQITNDELVVGLKKFDPETNYSDEDINQLFLKLDSDHDGSITFGEWCEFLILIPGANVKNVVKYWQTVVTLCDPNELTLYGLSKTLPVPLPLVGAYEELRNWFVSFGSGFLAGVISRTSMAPLDRLKLNYQVHYTGDKKPPSILTGLSELYVRDGFKGLFRGNMMTIIRAGPETSIKLTVFEKLKTILSNNGEKKTNKKELFVAGAAAGVMANVVTFPLGVVRTRMAASPSGTYSGIMDTITKMRHREGAILPFYRGLQPALLAIVPNSGLNLMSYEALKRLFIGKRPNTEPGPLVFMTIGGISALFSNTLLYPLQTVTTRSVMQGLLAKPEDRKGMVQMIRHIYHKEGTYGFYKGYRAAITKIFFGNGISFGCYEFFKKTFGIDFKKKH